MSYTLAWILKCLKLYPSISLIDDSAAAIQPLSRFARVADAATQPLCQSGWSSHSATLPESLTQPLSHSARVAGAATQPLCQNGWRSHSATLQEWLEQGKRITLEHTLRHHFRTQPFCITLEHKIKHLMETPPYTHIRFTDRRETLEEKRVPKRDQHKKPPAYENLTRFNHVIKSHACHVKGSVDVQKCHTCHAKWRSMSKGPTPATENEGEYMKQKPCCTWCKKSNETFRIYMLLHLMYGLPRHL